MSGYDAGPKWRLIQAVIFGTFLQSAASTKRTGPHLCVTCYRSQT
jgi:hypothetical protein